MATFTWKPDTGSTQKREPAIRSAKFGDGYEQRAPAGLNADMRERTVNFSGRSASENSAIQAFLEAQGGTASFDYTHPGDISRKYVCKSWTVTDVDGANQSVSAVFTQVPL